MARAGAEDSSDFDGDDDDAAAPLERAFSLRARRRRRGGGRRRRRRPRRSAIPPTPRSATTTSAWTSAAVKSPRRRRRRVASAPPPRRRSRSSASDAAPPRSRPRPRWFSKLLRTYFAVDARSRPRLAQCLAVFFPALASGPEDRRRLVSDAALPTLRARGEAEGGRQGGELPRPPPHGVRARRRDGRLNRRDRRGIRRRHGGHDVNVGVGEDRPRTRRDGARRSVDRVSPQGRHSR